MKVYACSFLALVLGVALFVAPMVATAFPVTVNVSANPEWTSTGIMLNSGDMISITASGSWRHDTCCGPFYGPDGDPTWLTNQFGFITSAPMGMLIGAIEDPGRSESYFRSLPQDDPIFFTIGSDLSSFTALVSGMLYLGFNDWAFPGNQPAVSDNAGSVTATIDEVAPVPEPATLIFVGFGLLGVFGFVGRRRKGRK